MISFKKYEKRNFNDVVWLMEAFQDHIVSLDTLKKQRRLPEYGKRYTADLAKKITREKGLFLLAIDEKKIVGFTAGVIEKQSKENLLECLPTKIGRVLELFVTAQYRGQGLGEKLMHKMEEFFKKNKCDAISVEAFAPNVAARAFYKKLRYSERSVQLLKILSYA